MIKNTSQLVGETGQNVITKALSREWLRSVEKRALKWRSVIEWHRVSSRCATFFSLDWERSWVGHQRPIEIRASSHKIRCDWKVEQWRPKKVYSLNVLPNIEQWKLTNVCGTLPTRSSFDSYENRGPQCARQANKTRPFKLIFACVCVEQVYICIYSHT